MNKKGQVLVLFIIMIPLFIACLALVIDVGYSMHHSYRLNNVNRMVIKYGLERIDEVDIRAKMVDLLYKNDSDIDSYDLVIEDNQITLKTNKTVDSVFGKVINIDFYSISSEYVGYIRQDKLVIEKG